MLFKKKTKEVVEKVNHDNEYSGYNHVELYDIRSNNSVHFDANFTKGSIKYIYTNIGKDIVFCLADDNNIAWFAVNLRFYSSCTFSIKEKNK